MGKTESLFAGVLLATVALAVALVVFRGNGGDHSNDRRDSNRGGREMSDFVSGTAFTGNGRSDLCTCYEQAYSYGMRDISLESLEYRGGFSECSKRLGAEGSQAWTDGWANGERAPNAPRSCRAYMASAR